MRRPRTARHSQRASVGDGFAIQWPEEREGGWFPEKGVSRAAQWWNAVTQTPTPFPTPSSATSAKNRAVPDAPQPTLTNGDSEASEGSPPPPLCWLREGVASVVGCLWGPGCSPGPGGRDRHTQKTASGKQV